MVLQFKRKNTAWALVIAIGLVVGVVLGWRIQPMFSTIGAHHEENDERCLYWPATTASFLPVNSLDQLMAESDLVVKGEVTARRWIVDTYLPLGDDRRPPEWEWSLHDVKVLDTVKGILTNSEVITFGSSIRGCLPIGTTAYMFFRETDTAKKGGYVDSPNEYQNPGDYTTGPLRIFLVKDSRVEPLFDAFPPENPINAVKGIREQDFNSLLRSLVE